MLHKKTDKLNLHKNGNDIEICKKTINAQILLCGTMYYFSGT